MRGRNKIPGWFSDSQLVNYGNTFLVCGRFGFVVLAVIVVAGRTLQGRTIAVVVYWDHWPVLQCLRTVPV